MMNNNSKTMIFPFFGNLNSFDKVYLFFVTKKIENALPVYRESNGGSRRKAEIS